mmetsp:Transcript_11552/g.71048  ORF Transcript_11552/g.71048 Transcript_11552/m.71048 type:complete len:253 (-) Transcript_11552:100-858(-)
MPFYASPLSTIADHCCSNTRWDLRPPSSLLLIVPSFPTISTYCTLGRRMEHARCATCLVFLLRLSVSILHGFVERHELEVSAHAKFHHDATARLDGWQEGQVSKFCTREDLSVLDPDHHTSRFVLQAVQRTCEDAFFVVPSYLLLSQVRHAHTMDLGQVGFQVTQTTCVEVDHTEVSTTHPVRVASFQATFGRNAHAKCAALVQKLRETLAVGTDEVGAHVLQPRRRSGSRTNRTEASTSCTDLRETSMRTC